MGRLKDWAMSEQLCVVCSEDFIPWDVKDTHEIDLGAPTCSKKCYAEYHHIMNAMADLNVSSISDLCEECQARITDRSQSA